MPGENVPELLVETVLRAEAARVFPSTMFSENLGAESQSGAEPAPVSMSRVSALPIPRPRAGRPARLRVALGPVRSEVVRRCCVRACVRACLQGTTRNLNLEGAGKTGATNWMDEAPAPPAKE
jgi:hypothetical protein